MRKERIKQKMDCRDCIDGPLLFLGLKCLDNGWGCSVRKNYLQIHFSHDQTMGWLSIVKTKGCYIFELIVENMTKVILKEKKLEILSKHFISDNFHRDWWLNGMIKQFNTAIRSKNSIRRKQNYLMAKTFILNGYCVNSLSPDEFTVNGIKFSLLDHIYSYEIPENSYMDFFKKNDETWEQIRKKMLRIVGDFTPKNIPYQVK